MPVSKKTVTPISSEARQAEELQAVTEAIRDLVERLGPLQASRCMGQLPLESVHALVEAAIRVYGAVRVESGEKQLRPFSPKSRLSATHVAMMADGLLAAADMDVFELTFWRSMGRH